MQYTFAELWNIIRSRNAEVNTLSMQVEAHIKQRKALLAELDKANAELDKVKGGLRIMGETVGWLADNQRNF